MCIIFPGENLFLSDSKQQFCHKLTTVYNVQQLRNSPPFGVHFIMIKHQVADKYQPHYCLVTIPGISLKASDNLTLATNIGSPSRGKNSGRKDVSVQKNLSS